MKKSFNIQILIILLSFVVLLSLSSRHIMSCLDDILAPEYIHEINSNQFKERRILSLFNKIVFANSLDRKNYTLHLENINLNSPSIAWLCYGRRVFLIRDFPEFFYSEQGLAFVLAHEIAHGELKHNGLSDLFASDKIHRQRQEELAADALALDLLAKLYGPNQLETKKLTELFYILQRIENHIELKNGKVLTRDEWQAKFSNIHSHPSDQERIKAIKEKLKRIKESYEL